MAYLKNNFAAAEMLWDNVEQTQARVSDINLLLKRVPRVARLHLKGLDSKSIVEVFNRMLFYYRHEIGWVSRSTIDRRGKFKKASNINTHLRLVFGAQQISQETKKPLAECLVQCAHNDDGSRHVMFGNNIMIGHLMVLNDADARMSPAVIYKTVPEFLNDNFLGFTQHTTKTLDDQRNETYYLRMLQVYTDFLYQGHFLLSSIMGCHPPLVGHSVFLRSDALRQVGRIRTLRSAQKWLKNIGLPFLGVDQIGFRAVTDTSRTEYWSECHVSEDFELMIHLYNLGYKGRYVAFKDCEFQEGVTRTFDEEAGRHRKFALGAHELMFNPFQDIFSRGLYSSLFKTFIRCDIPSYYKIYLTAYLQSYMSGGVWYLVFTIATILRLAGGTGTGTLYAFSPVAVLVLVVFIYYVIGYTCFLLSLCRMRMNNSDVFFPEYRKHGCFYIIYKMLRYCMSFQFWFYTCMGNYFFLGGMDHMLARPNICGATNKDSIDISMCSALWDIWVFNWGSYLIALYQAGLAFCVLLHDIGWDITFKTFPGIGAWLYAGPAIYLSVMEWVVPTLMNPYVCPCTRPKAPKKEKGRRTQKSKDIPPRRSADMAKPPPRPHSTRKPTASNTQTNGYHSRPKTKSPPTSNRMSI
jgi:cellulose synthase/poly-beta-1,6-N-acetylglucosamine synthase-like glycosyltransferase